MKKINIILLFLFSTILSKDFVKTNSLYFELLGAGGLYSINYEKEIKSFTNQFISYRSGLMFFYIPAKWPIYLSHTEKTRLLSGLINGFTYCFGPRAHKLEGSLIFELAIELGDRSSTILKGFLYPYIGYRFQPKDNRITSRFGIIIYKNYENLKLPIYPSISVGFRF